MNEFPDLILKISDIKQKNALLCEFIYFNNEFMSAKVILNDLEFVKKINSILKNEIEKKKISDNLRDLLTIGNIYLQNIDLLCKNPHSFHFQMQSRLLNYYSCSRNIERFINQMDDDVKNEIIPLNSCHNLLNNADAIHLYHSTSPILYLRFCYEYSLLFTCSEKEVCAFNMNTLVNLGSIDIQEYNIKDIKAFLVLLNKVTDAQYHNIRSLSGEVRSIRK